MQCDITSQLQSHQVYIETTHSGLCGTDEHYLRANQALGHEGIGIVREVGSAVKSVENTGRVGFGYPKDLCATHASPLTNFRTRMLIEYE